MKKFLCHEWAELRSDVLSTKVYFRVFSSFRGISRFASFFLFVFNFSKMATADQDPIELLLSNDNENEQALFMLCEDGCKETILSFEHFLKRDPVLSLRNFLSKILQLGDDDLNVWIRNQGEMPLIMFLLDFSSYLTSLNKPEYFDLLQTVGDFFVLILHGEFCSEIVDCIFVSIFPKDEFSMFTSDLIVYLSSRLPASFGYSFFYKCFKALKSFYYEKEQEDFGDSLNMIDSIQEVQLIIILRRIFSYLLPDEITKLKTEFSLEQNVDLWKHIYNL